MTQGLHSPPPPNPHDHRLVPQVKNSNSLQLDFPNLPYLIDGDVRITQSSAILRYIGRQFDLLGGSICLLSLNP